MATKVFLPRLGESIEEAIIGHWLKKVGDEVKRGDVIVELETSKATMDLESPGKGILLATFPKEGETVQKGTLIAIVGKEGEDWQELIEEDDAVKDKSEDKTARIEQEAERKAQKTSGIERIKISPNARRILKDREVDINTLAERFPNKRITSTNVKAYLSDMQMEGAADKPIESVELTRSQAETAKLMVKSQKEIPAFSLTKEINADKMLARYADVKQGQKNITLTTMIIQMTAGALRGNSEVNAFYSDGKMRIHPQINIAIAINTDAGVVSPVIKNADKLSINEIADRLEELVKKTSESKLKMDDLSGGTFIISNLGMMGIDQFVPMITPGQGAVMGIGKVSEKITLDSEGKISKKSVISATINADHRILSGAEAAKFLNDLETEMQKDDG